MRLAPTAPISLVLATTALSLALGGCSRGPKTQRFLLEGSGLGPGWSGYSLTVAGYPSPPAKPDESAVPRYVDVPGSEPVAEGALVEFRWKTPCGEQVRSFPLPKPTFNDQGVMMVKMPASLEAPPPLTRVFFPRGMKGTLKLGELSLEAPKMVEVADLGCVKSATLGDREVPLPKLEPPPAVEREAYASGDATVGVLFTDDASACYTDELVAFGTGEWAKSWSQRLTGANAYVLGYTKYDYYFEAIPDDVRLRGGSTGTSKSSLNLCASP